MGWERLEYERPMREELRRVIGDAKFYADHNLDESIVLVLRHQGHDVETAREIGAERQPDEYHYRRALKTKRVLLTEDGDYLDNRRFPLSQTRGVVVFNIDISDTGQIARAVEVVDVILSGIAPVLDEVKVIVNSDYSLTFIRRVRSDEGLVEERTRYRLDENGRDVWIWED